MVAAEATSVGAGPVVVGSALRLTRRQHRRVVRSVEGAELATGAQFCVYLGPTGEDPRAHAEAMFHQAGLRTRPAILLLVSPERRHVEIVTSAGIRDRVSDRICSEAVTAMTGLFTKSDIAGGIVAGIERLQAAVGPASGAPPEEPFPDMIEE